MSFRFCPSTFPPHHLIAAPQPRAGLQAPPLHPWLRRNRPSLLKIISHSSSPATSLMSNAFPYPVLSTTLSKLGCLRTLPPGSRQLAQQKLTNNPHIPLRLFHITHMTRSSKRVPFRLRDVLEVGVDTTRQGVSNFVLRGMLDGVGGR